MKTSVPSLYTHLYIIALERCILRCEEENYL